MAAYSSSYILCILTISFLFLNAVNGAIFFQPNATHPDYPNQCYFDGPPVTILNIGQTKRTSEHCFKLTCNEEFLLSITGCGVIESRNHCHVVKGDISRPYPDCCDELVC